MNKQNFRIYVACLASYNNGVLHGCWIEDLQDKSEEDVFEEITAMLKQSSIPLAEEWAIHDHEGFDGLHVSESYDIGKLVDYASAIDGSTHDVDLIHGVCDQLQIDAQQAIEYIDEHHQGEYNSLADYAMDFLEDTGALDSMSKHLQNYFDYESYARDLELNGDVFTISAWNGGVHVLTNR